MIKKAVLVFVAGFLLLGCLGNNVKKNHKAIGTVIFKDLEGGFYGIITDDDKKLLPLNLNKSFKVNNLRIEFNYTESDKVFTIFMWGKPVEVSNVKILD